MVVHLNLHSCYDLLQSTVRIKEVVAAAKADGQRALAITDTHVLYGIQAFYRECLKHDIKPITGMTVHLTDGHMNVDAVILAMNQEGYDNLLKLSSKIQLKGLDIVPLSLFERYRKDTIAIFKQLPAELNHLVEDADGYACHLSAVAEEKKVYLSPIRYMKPSGLQDLTVLKAIDNNDKLMLETLDHRTGEEYFMTSSRLAELDVSSQYIARTEEIADRCSVKVNHSLSRLPKFRTPNNETSDDYLWSLIQQGKHKIAHFDERYEQRMQHEYRIITEMGFSDYFLIVGDLINYAKSKGILVGPGRGSSGGSLVSYLLNITMIDPIEHGLFFERFLNPERVTMPDIDIDFEDTRREEVIRYCTSKYGAFNVSGIVTFGHLLARAVMRDVGRILQFSEDDLKYVSHLMPKKQITLTEAYHMDDFKAFVTKDERHKKWYAIACQLEGLPKHTSTHAAGIIIHDQLLTDYVPLIQGDDINLTQWTMTEVEQLGLLKIDFLGLRNLTIIQRVLQQAKINLTTDTINYDDAHVFRALSAADTNGVFQLESAGMRNVLKRLQPKNFEDIVAVLSLYRPGPMEQIPTYIERRHGQPVTYLHPDLEPILNKTYGVIIYQEQIMQIANQFAGFSLGEADNLRRAMSKKKRDVLEAEKQHFIEGSLKNGYDRKMAEQIYELILKFADYGFPRAHAVAYAQIAYMMMYLKVRYPSYFYASIMSNVIGSEDKMAAFISELKSKNISFTSPSINESHWFVRAVDDTVILSLGMIKGLGYRTVMDIIDERRNGRFIDLYDVVHRLPSRTMTRPVLEALILTGAFDEFKMTRATLLATLDEVLNVGADNQQEDHFLEDLGLNLKKKYQHHEEMSEEQKAAAEYKHLGFFLSEHPVEKRFNEHLYLPLYQIQQAQPGQYILAAVSELRRIRTKKGQPMAFAKVMDGISELELVIFPAVFQSAEKYLLKNELIVVKGKFDRTSDKLIADSLQSFDAFKINYMNQLKEIYVLKKPKIQLGQGTIKLFEYSMKTGRSDQLALIDKVTAEQLLETYPPEMIRVI
ncbi:DNA polymerase III subunit alpha [Macrococcus lamae]|uniref:DNA-directed DNA polymerase n=1 Tax=Macrococcus lamae TaxID=198484 RepID=A0A4R6BU45_9STAP|nr:DNA polymerase III subunit alpha [Macrococcus lamae]TDM10611.1 DNA polymerase III subunit alpha [Macrococcus lamae]